MQSRAQEQPLALTAAVKPHYSTNGREEEVNSGEAAVISPTDRKVKEPACEESFFW